MVVLVRYSEIGLKGGNRGVFEKKLIDNMRSCLAKNKVKFSAIRNLFGRIFIETDERCECLACVFGIASFSPAIDAGQTMDSAKKASEPLIKNLKKKMTFRVSCQRLDKSFPFDSQEFERELGAFVVEKKGNRARMKGFDFELAAELLQGRIFLFTERIAGQGGLPVGVEGKVIAIIGNENKNIEQDILAALLMLKRGCAVIPALTKKLKTGSIEILEKFGSREKPVLIKKLAELDELAEKLNAKAVVSGQTLENFKDFKLKTEIFRPLIAYDENEIKKQLEQFRQEIC
jgi:thiamine biosynthesis protein ThiI